MLIYPAMPLGDVIAENPSLIPVIGRLGIRLGLGERSVADVASEHGIDPLLLVMILNTFLDDCYFPEKKLRSVEVSRIIDYLEKTNAHYLDSQLPNIERHLRAFIAHSRIANNSLDMLWQLFTDFKNEVVAQIDYDDSRVFPGFREGRRPPPVPFESQEETPGLLAEMCNIMIRHLTGDYDMNLCYAVIFTLKSMQRDMDQNNRIRSRILWPVKRSPHRRPAEMLSGRALTPREVDVLRLIVAGKINREIADELFISFQTVLSHRKNITSKLGIKSVSGLTMYALMKGYVDQVP